MHGLSRAEGGDGVSLDERTNYARGNIGNPMCTCEGTGFVWIKDVVDGKESEHVEPCGCRTRRPPAAPAPAPPTETDGKSRAAGE